MKHVVLFLAILFAGFFTVPTVAKAEGMVNRAVLERVFSIQMGDKRGSAFTIEVEGRQYLITARHITEPRPKDGLIQVFRESGWLNLPYQQITVLPASVDIAVLALQQQLSPTSLVVTASAGQTFLSQEVFFLGYPFNLAIQGVAVNNGYPLPFVKRGIVAAFQQIGQPTGFLIVDGINNPGFSGGPVVDVRNIDRPAVIGVVSGYRFNEEPVFRGKTRTKFNVQANTGLLIAYPIERAIEAIRRKPIGFKIQ